MKGEMMILKVIGERVLVKQRDNIAFDESVEAREGIVIAVGNGILTDSGRVPLTVAVGDTVFYGKYAPCEVVYMGIVYTIIREDDILVFWREDERGT